MTHLPRLRSAAGQAAVDYVGVLAVAAVVLGGTGAAVAAATSSGVPHAVVHATRTALCIVGGDVCRASDAAAEGLAPCLTAETANGHGLAVTILSLHLGHHGSLTVAQRSDGSVLVTKLANEAIGLTGGIGVELGPAIEVGADATFDLTLAHGEAWELPSTVAAAGLVAALRHGDVPPTRPTWRFGDAGEEAGAGVGVLLGGKELTPLEASAGSAVGVRTGRGETTTYVRAHADLTSALVRLWPSAKGDSGGPDGAGAPLLLGVTRDAHGLRELSFRRATPGRSTSEVVETVGRLDLRDPANRAAASPLLGHAVPTPDDLHTVLLRTARVGVIERSVYAVDDDSSDVAGEVKLGVELGVDVSQLDVRRRLVDAGAWVAGSPERRRADCLPELA